MYNIWIYIYPGSQAPTIERIIPWNCWLYTLTTTITFTEPKKKTFKTSYGLFTYMKGKIWPHEQGSIWHLGKYSHHLGYNHPCLRYLDSKKKHNWTAHQERKSVNNCFHTGLAWQILGWFNWLGCSSLRNFFIHPEMDTFFGCKNMGRVVRLGPVFSVFAARKVQKLGWTRLASQTNDLLIVETVYIYSVYRI